MGFPALRSASRTLASLAASSSYSLVSTTTPQSRHLYRLVMVPGAGGSQRCLCPVITVGLRAPLPWSRAASWRGGSSHARSPSLSAGVPSAPACARESPPGRPRECGASFGLSREPSSDPLWSCDQPSACPSLVTSPSLRDVHRIRLRGAPVGARASLRSYLLPPRLLRALPQRRDRRAAQIAGAAVTPESMHAIR